MLDILTVVAPVFAVIALGYATARLELIRPEIGKSVSDFAFLLAVPALLFRTMAQAEPSGAAALGVLATFFCAAAAVWLLAAVGTRVLLRRPAADGASIAMNATFGNVVMLGLPLALSGFGAAAWAPMALIISLHTPLLWLIASLHMALADQSQDTPLRIVLAALFKDLIRNPIIVSVLAGTLWRFTDLGLAAVVDQTLALLGQASVPCALVALGMSLTGFRIAGQAPTLTMICFLKLLVMPLLAWLLGSRLFALPEDLLALVVLLAAMPTGANAFVFASRHGRALNSASGAVALGTAITAITAPMIMTILRG